MSDSGKVHIADKETLDEVNSKIGTASDGEADETKGSMLGKVNAVLTMLKNNSFGLLALGNKIDAVPQVIIDKINALSGDALFLEDGTFTVPDGVTTLKVWGCGAGGVVFAGEYAIGQVLHVIPGQVLTIECGEDKRTAINNGDVLLLSKGAIEENLQSTIFENNNIILGKGGNAGGGRGGYGGAFGFGGCGGGRGGKGGDGGAGGKSSAYVGDDEDPEPGRAGSYGGSAGSPILTTPFSVTIGTKTLEFKATTSGTSGSAGRGGGGGGAYCTVIHTGGKWELTSSSYASGSDGGSSGNASNLIGNTAYGGRGGSGGGSNGGSGGSGGSVNLLNENEDDWVYIDGGGGGGGAGGTGGSGGNAGGFGAGGGKGGEGGAGGDGGHANNVGGSSGSKGGSGFYGANGQNGTGSPGFLYITWGA